jgi:hypothetical protein
VNKYLDFAIESMLQLSKARYQLKNLPANDPWQEYWEHAVEFWARSVSEWLKLAKENSE